MTHTKTEAFSFTSMQQAAPVHIPERQFISSHDGTSLAYYPFLSEKNTQANVILIHGGGAHSLAGYEHIAYTLQHDFHVNVFLLDLRGHGHSQGKKGIHLVSRMYGKICRRLWMPLNRIIKVPSTFVVILRERACCLTTCLGQKKRSRRLLFHRT